MFFESCGGPYSELSTDILTHLNKNVLLKVGQRISEMQEKVIIGIDLAGVEKNPTGWLCGKTKLSPPVIFTRIMKSWSI